MRRKKLAIVSTHPIQYYAPVFRSLAQSASIHPRVFYTWPQAAAGPIRDPGFAADIRWDIPLMEAYEYELVPNVAREPGSSRFFGIDNPSLVPAIDSWGPDAVLVFGWNLYSHLQALRRFKGRVPVFFRGDSTLLDQRSALRSVVRKHVLRWVYRHVDVAIAVGRNNSDYFRYHGIAPERVCIAPHCVDTRRFAADAPLHAARAAAWRRELGIGEQDRVLLYAGKLIPQKDPLLLLSAFLELAERGHLVFCGNGPLEGEVKRRAAGHPRVHFMPFQNQSAMPAVYRLGDAYVLPSRSETWGLGLNEAQACGRAVVAGSRVGGARDLVVQGVNGWLFESGNREDLVRVLATVLSIDRAALESMGETAQRASHAWSTDETARRIAAIVVSFLQERSVASSVCGASLV
jgi:glycosyltransferase involved in cell wall biosynthesis